MRKIFTPLILFVASCPVHADTPYVKLPATVSAKPNRYFAIKPTDTNCKNLKWIVPAGLDTFDPGIFVLKDPQSMVFIGDAGTYTVSCYGALGDQPSEISSCTVTIGTPPPPAPPTPPPTDPLVKALQTGYTLDTDTDRATSLAFLRQIYPGMAGQALGWSDVKTNGDAIAKMRSIIQSPGIGLNVTQVQNLRKAIAAEFAAKFGTSAAAAIDLTALANELKAIGAALLGVK